jgi:nitrogen fixation NifU-like protein
MTNDFQDLYQDIVMDHNRRPRNYGELQDFTKSSEGFNPLCGDQLTLYVKLKNGILENISFTGVGCAISKSSASMMTEHIKGKSVAEAIVVFGAFRDMLTDNVRSDFPTDILEDLEIFSGVSQFPTRIKCATLCWHTLNSALSEQNIVITTDDNNR